MMNRNITIIVGLPASGKTTLARSIAFGTTSILIDDPKSLDELPDNFEHLIITDPFLCRHAVRARMISIVEEKYPGCILHWIFFKNDPTQCLINASTRQRAVQGFIKMLTEEYEIPPESEFVTVKDVWRGS